jgi:2-methylcitrate dehydratase PrpD
MTLAERLAAFADALRYEDLPPAVVSSARLRLLDLLGIALASSVSEVAPPILAALAAGAESGPCTVVGTSRTAEPALAILVNGALGHALDYDDTHAASITHASAVVLPTVLALGERAALSGPALIVAAVVGYEAITRLGMAAGGHFHARGWHATAVCGAFAAALAAGKCLGLDARQLTSALGVAGSFAAGSLEFLADGSPVKRLHPGWAGQAGALAATLARGGFTGPPTILEGRFGFYRTYAGVDPDPAPFETLGREWEILRVGFKPYPCCHYNHAYLDCALELRHAHAIAPASVTEVECLVPQGEVPIVCEPRAAKRRPRTPYEAQFSLPYSVAAALLDGQVTLDTYAAHRLEDERLLALASRVTYRVDPTSSFPDGFPGWLRVTLDDGRVVEARQPDGRGGPRRPLPETAIVEKFRDNAGRALPRERVAHLERAALALDGVSDARTLMALVRG